jgi:hypothetical protein
MAEPQGHTLLTQAFGVMNQALEAHPDEALWGEIVARTTGAEEQTFVVAVHDGMQTLECYLVGVHEGRFRMVGRVGVQADAQWRVSVDHLRKIAAQSREFVDDPEKLDLAWLPRLLSERTPQPKAWRLRPDRPRRSTRRSRRHLAQ